jgi:hypothetical protein
MAAMKLVECGRFDKRRGSDIAGMKSIGGLV